MSRDNVQFVLDGYRRFNDGETRPELWFWHEDAEFHASRDDPDTAIHRGLDAIRARFASWFVAANYPLAHEHAIVPRAR